MAGWPEAALRTSRAAHHAACGRTRLVYSARAFAAARSADGGAAAALKSGAALASPTEALQVAQTIALLRRLEYS